MSFRLFQPESCQGFSRSQLGQSHSGMPSRSPSGSGSATGIMDPPFSRIVVNNSSGRTDPLGALEGLAWLAEFPGSENSHANTDAPSGSRALRRSPFRKLPD